jgi:Xaa-Pro aminopeptidase
MNNLFSSTFFKDNRQALRNRVNGLLVFTASGLLQRSADTTFPYRQDSNFWYLTGITEPDILLVMEGSDEYLIVPDRGKSKQIFDGSIDTAKLSQISGVIDVFDEKEGLKKLQSTLKRANEVASFNAPDSYVAQAGIYTNPARNRLLDMLTKHLVKDAAVKDIRAEMVALRMLKQPPELNAIKEAIAITVEAFREVMRQRNDYMYEYEVAADITRHFMRHKSPHAYEPIIAGGKRACTLHYISNGHSLDTSELLLIDAGAEVEGYAADITRTLSLDKPTARQTAVQEAVKNVQEFALEQIKPGVFLKEYEQSVEKKMGEELKRLKLIKTPDREAVRRYYPHATSHFLGLDVHDVADYTKPLLPGMVLTVEPGIYIPEESIGVRIEDDILVTESGIEVLSKNLPSSLA